MIRLLINIANRLILLINNRHIVETALILLALAQMPMKLWWEAIKASVYLINRLLIPVIDHISPFEKLFK